MNIPVSIPFLGGNEEKYVLKSLKSTWISSTGEFVSKFEEDFAKFCGTKYALSVCNGTVALHLALLGLDLQPGDEVLVPSLSYVATANAVKYVNAVPVFVDVDPNTWCIDPQRIEDAITPRTRAIIPVHLYGHPADMDAINKIAAVHGLSVIEDAAEAHGALYKNRPVGGLSSIGTFSFYGNKVLTCGEGGAVTLNDDKLYQRLKMLRGQGMDPDRRYFFPIIGYNFRLTNVACAILCAQLENYDLIMSRRRQVSIWYADSLKGVAGIRLQPVSSDVSVTPWLYCITVDEQSYGRSREDVMSLLTSEGIETRPFFIPIHSLPPYRQEAAARGCLLPVTDTLAQIGINLPLYPTLSESAVKRICEVLRSGAK
jgi:perosamine synthetase